MWVEGCVWSCMSPLKIIFDCLKIIACNKAVFTTIMALTTLPLSALTVWETTCTHALSSQIHRLEALARHVPTRFEARHVMKESRHDALSLLRIKLLFSLPSYLLSLAAALSAIHSALSASPTLRSAASAAAHSWHRLFLTSIVVYAILFAFSPLPRLLAILTAAPSSSATAASRSLALAIGSFLEVYLMAVLSLGLVVSVAEERFGWDAIRVGHGLMAGRRVCGWVLSGLFVAVSGLIWSKLDALLEGQTGVEEKAILIIWYAFVVLWSYVAMTAFYRDCRKRHPIKENLPDDNYDQQLELSL